MNGPLGRFPGRYALIICRRHQNPPRKAALMRRLASIIAFAIALTVAPVSLASANAAPLRPATVSPQTPQWVYFFDVPEQWICIYEGNQLVASGKYQASACLAGHTGIAVWAETY
jgi:hypothetical protein